MIWVKPYPIGIAAQPRIRAAAVRLTLRNGIAHNVVMRFESNPFATAPDLPRFRRRRPWILHSAGTR
jgi:hypothetical protein